MKQLHFTAFSWIVDCQYELWVVRKVIYLLPVALNWVLPIELWGDGNEAIVTFESRFDAILSWIRWRTAKSFLCNMSPGVIRILTSTAAAKSVKTKNYKTSWDIWQMTERVTEESI